MKDYRYQFQPWHIKAWRWFLCIPKLLPLPLYILWSWHYERTRPLRNKNDWRLPLKHIFTIHLEVATLKLQHWYKMEEVFPQGSDNKNVQN